MKSIITVYLTIIVLLSGCGISVETGGVINDTTFWSMQYEKENINVSIPVIGTAVFKNVDGINSKLRKDALGILHSEKDIKTLELGHSIDFVNDRIISVRFMGKKCVENIPQESNIFFTSNIDIETGTDLDINEMLLVNEQLVDTIKNKAELINASKQNKENAKKLNRLLKQYDSQKLFSGINSQTAADNKISVYFTQEALGISLPVKHTFGDYANYEIDYKDISAFLIENLIQASIKTQLQFSDAMKNRDRDITNKIFKTEIAVTKEEMLDARSEDFGFYSAHADISGCEEDIVFIMINSLYFSESHSDEDISMGSKGNAKMYVCSKKNTGWGKIEVDSIPSTTSHFFNDKEKDRIFVLESSTGGYHDLKWYDYELAKYRVFKYNKWKKTYMP